ncbi:MAG: AAA family ATPase [Gammaproteobacteria bacterium]
MSIVERALNKLKASAPAPAARAEPPPTIRVGRVVDVERPKPDAAALPQPRAILGNRLRTVRIDLAALRSNGFLPPEQHERELAHQFRTIKRPLIRHALPPGEPLAGPVAAGRRTIMVSSALPGEGKTFTAVNLALSLAMEKDHSILLVDGDVAKPNISQIFGAGNEPGLLELLADARRSVESVILSTDTPRLSLLPAGKPSDVATELLASARMRQVLDNLERIDPHLLIVCDSPPILLTSEARVLASLFEQVVLVVRAGATQQQAVIDAIEAIGDKPGLRLVLNQAHRAGAAGNYYGYGYVYGYAASEASNITQTGKS